jgi:hypothetical protein
MQGGLSGIAQQGPYAGRPISQVPWMTPQQLQQYRQTGQLPQQSAMQRMQGVANQPPTAINPVTGRPYNPARLGDLAPEERARRMQDAKARQDQNPPSPDAQVVHNKDGTLTANIPGRGRVTVSRTDENGNPMTDQEAIQKYAKPVSDQPVQDTGGGVNGPYPNTNIQGRVANVMSAGGMSPNAIAGVFQNIVDESNWNPNMRHPDQPRWRGTEAMYAHGLFQEGGPDWAPFQKFLNGRNWQDPSLQAQFMMQHFKQQNPRAWAAMNNARTPGEAAQIFVSQYLKPAAQYRNQRMARYGRGVASLDQVMGRRGTPASDPMRSAISPLLQGIPMSPPQMFRPNLPSAGGTFRPVETPPTPPPPPLPQTDPNQVQSV